MMPDTATWDSYRGKLETYFDRTAFEAWKAMTSDAPVSRIRATVRAGRDRTRSTLLNWLPADMTGRRLLDAGCGTGALAVEAARRGAHVVAVDVSAQLVGIARERAPADLGGGTIDFRVGDMLSADHGDFDHVVAMDSLIHYPLNDIVAVVASLCGRTRGSVLFTVAPQTPALSVLHAVGLAFPRKDRAPAIIPVNERALRRKLDAALTGWQSPMTARTTRISGGFYKSQVYELVRA